MSDTIHVIPINDLIEHDTFGDGCVCGATWVRADEAWILQHHSLDGREHSEPDHDKSDCPLCCQEIPDGS
jgi:hypothetical protein